MDSTPVRGRHIGLRAAKAAVYITAIDIQRTSLAHSRRYESKILLETNSIRHLHNVLFAVSEFVRYFTNFKQRI